MNYKLLLGLILLSVIVFPYLPAMTQGGQVPTTMKWYAITQQDVGITEVARGTYDVFLFSNPLPWYEGLPEDVRANLTLIKTAAGFWDIVLNPAQNVIDPSKPGKVQLLGAWYPGQYIPGIVYVDPPSDWVNWSDVTDYTKLHFNPFALYKVRQALNYLVDRSLIISQVLGGSGQPRYGAISSLHPFYEVGNLDEIYFTWFGFTPTGDKDRAVDLFLQAMQEVNVTLATYGMYVYYDPGQDRWIFHKPDGSEEVIEVTFAIRLEDERKDMGLQVADWIEEYFNISVYRALRDRTIIYPIYVDSPVYTKAELDGRMWHMYTEGWVSTAEDIDVYARYDVAFFYAPTFGYASNSGFIWWWYWFNQTFYDVGYILYYGTFTEETVDQLFDNITLGLKMGLNESMRIFICDTFEYFAVNKYTVLGVTPGKITGLYTLWALRTLNMSKDTANLLEYSSTGALFMSSWNPVLGFTDIYSELMHRLATDFSMWPRPDTGMPEPIRVAYWSLERGVSLPSDAYIYDPVNSQWTHISSADCNFTHYVWEEYGGYEIINETTCTFNASAIPTLNKVTLTYKLSKWHDNSTQNVYDFLYVLGFNYEWAYDDSISTGETDPYYEDGIESDTLGWLSTIFGWKFINDTTFEVYMDYDDVYDILVAWYATIYPDMPWHVMYAAEEIIATAPSLPSGNTYAWESEAGKTGISFIEPDHANDIAYYMQNNLSIGPRMPPYITTYPGISAPSNTEVWDRYNKTVNFINTYHHAYISSGPYYITDYNPATFELTMKAFPNYIRPLTHWIGKFPVKRVVLLSAVVKPVVWLVYGQGIYLRVDFRFEQISPTYQVLTFNASDLLISVTLLDQYGNFVADLSNYTQVLPNGSVLLKVPAAELQKYIPVGHTPYYLVYSISHIESSNSLTDVYEIEIYSSPVVPAPEPNILPLILLAALLLIILIIRRK